MRPDSDEDFIPHLVAEFTRKMEAVRLLMRLEEEHFGDLGKLPKKRILLL
jgi:hypothetical protein